MDQASANLDLVKFQTSQTYVTDIPINLKYSVTDPAIVGPEDSVALYRVPWDATTAPYSVENIRTYQTGNERTVTFPGDGLPEEDGEIYHFVYRNKNGQPQGVSRSFQFQLEMEDEEGEDGILMVRPRIEVLQRELNNAVGREKALQHTIEETIEMQKRETQRLLEERESLLQKSEKLSEYFDLEKKRNEELTAFVTSQGTIITELEDTLQLMTIEKENKDKEAEQQEKKIEELERRLKIDTLKFQTEAVVLNEAVLGLKASCKELKDRLGKLQPQLDKKKAENDRLNSQIEKLRVELQREKEHALMYRKQAEEKEESLSALQNQLDAGESRKYLMEQTIRSLERDLEVALKRQHETEADLREMFLNNRKLLGDYQELCTLHSDLKQENEKLNLQMAEMGDSCSARIHEMEVLAEENAKLREEQDILQQKDIMPTYCKDLQKRLDLAESYYEDLRKRYNKLVDKIRTMKQWMRNQAETPDEAKDQVSKSRPKGTRGIEPLTKVSVDLKSSKSFAQESPNHQPKKEEKALDTDRMSKTPEELRDVCQNIYPNPYITKAPPTTEDGPTEPRAFWAQLQRDRPSASTPPFKRIPFPQDWTAKTGCVSRVQKIEMEESTSSWSSDSDK